MLLISELTSHDPAVDRVCLRVHRHMCRDLSEAGGAVEPVRVLEALREQNRSTGQHESVSRPVLRVQQLLQILLATGQPRGLPDLLQLQLAVAIPAQLPAVKLL